MEKITELLNNLDNLGELIPKLDKLMGWVQWLISMAVRVGPLCLLVLGLIYLLIPPREANRKAGYRTYFGMGSVLAWRTTQFIAGVLMTVMGLILFFMAKGTVAKFEGLDLMAMVDKAMSAIKVQVIFAAVLYVGMFLLTAILFNRKGVCRFGKTANEALEALFMRENRVKSPKKKKAPQPEALPEEAAAPQESEDSYEKQGEQVITADDIVIEGLD